MRSNEDESVWKVVLPQVRVHDLKHTFGRRLRAAGVPLETRKVLLGHRNGDITTHYSAPELEELLEAANKVCEEKSGTGSTETTGSYRRACKPLIVNGKMARPEGFEPPTP